MTRKNLEPDATEPDEPDAADEDPTTALRRQLLHAALYAMLEEGREAPLARRPPAAPTRQYYNWRRG